VSPHVCARYGNGYAVLGLSQLQVTSHQSLAYGLHTPYYGTGYLILRGVGSGEELHKGKDCDRETRQFAGL
jgi:hypothetical protein